MKIYYSPHFAKQWRLIPPYIKKKAITKEAIFKKNPKDPRLNTHPIKGELKGNFAFSVDYHYRVIFYYAKDKSVIFALIGSHSIYG